MQTILAGIKPTGRPHLGNYFGYMKQMVDMQDQSDTRVLTLIADYHALNFIQNGDEMRSLTKDLVLDFLSIGLDPKRNVIFKQSDVAEHTELAWIFDTITTVPYLKRAHAYKDAVAKDKEEEVSVGTFNYPMLMAADILLYSPDKVPVGEDQQQHIEFARDTAEKFNRIYGDTFKLPEGLIIEGTGVVPGIDGRKMSKSYDNTIPLFATEEEIDKLCMSIVTDSEGDYPENVFRIHQLFRTNEELDKIYEENKGQYKVLKEMLAEDVKKFVKPFREKREELAKDNKLVSEILSNGAKQAREVASSKIREVKEAVGVL